MSKITEQMDVLFAVQRQSERVIKIKGDLQNAYTIIAQTNTMIQDIVDLGALNTIPTEIKAALNKAWGALKTCETALKAADIAEAINWVGKEE